MTIIVTGGDGYIGWPTALRIAARTDDRVLAVDNFARRDWVEEIGSVSGVPIAWMDERLDAARERHDTDNLSFVQGDLTDRSFVNELLSVHEPDTIVHAAAQPSAPYSQINGERANYTQHNNMQATRNLVWGLKEHDLTDTHFIETTTTGVYGAPEFPIPEGGAVMENQGERDEVPFPGMGGSWYHQCYDEQTEIMTKAGWKPFPELTEQDEVMAMDADTGETGWTTPSAVQSYEYDGEMVTISNDQVDLQITPNHRTLIGTSWEGDSQETFDTRRAVVDAAQLGTEYQQPCFFTSFPDWDGTDPDEFQLPECDQEMDHAAVVRLQPKSIEIDAWLRFFGLWVANGTIETENQSNTIRLYQNDATALTTLFADSEFEPETISHHAPQGSTQAYIEITDHQLATYLRQFEAQPSLPQWMRNLSQEHLEVLFTALVDDADDAQSDRGWTFETASQRLANHVQEVALKLGYGATVQNLEQSEHETERESQSQIETDTNQTTTCAYSVDISPTWCVQTNESKSKSESESESESENENANGDTFGREQYDGAVYCCTVDGGIVLVRRNGTPVWCGNSKSHDAANLRLASTQFGLPISDVRTAITYGTETEETRADDALKTRFDFDYYFGTVTHRFCAQAVAGYPVTVYGKGEQRKPFISLEDAVEGLAQLALIDPDDRPNDLTVYNQVTRAISIVEIAETIAEVGDEYDLDVAVEHFENPRDEDETHKMEIENDRYMDVIDEQAQNFEDGVGDIFETLTTYADRIEAHEDRFLPGVLED